mmetsp:Transcript_20514/g.42993  ORF Transcript_20514/g.42993 Transcript_20514/m.42993 type:complete len:434 (+) Transcript_20514:113-1414(+)
MIIASTKSLLFPGFVGSVPVLRILTSVPLGSCTAGLLIICGAILSCAPDSLTTTPSTCVTTRAGLASSSLVTKIESLFFSSFSAISSSTVFIASSSPLLPSAALLPSPASSTTSLGSRSPHCFCDLYPDRILFSVVASHLSFAAFSFILLSYLLFSVLISHLFAYIMISVPLCSSIIFWWTAPKSLIVVLGTSLSFSFCWSVMNFSALASCNLCLVFILFLLAISSIAFLLCSSISLLMFFTISPSASFSSSDSTCLMSLTIFSSTHFSTPLRFSLPYLSFHCSCNSSIPSPFHSPPKYFFISFSLLIFSFSLSEILLFLSFLLDSLLGLPPSPNPVTLKPPSPAHINGLLLELTLGLVPGETLISALLLPTLPSSFIMSTSGTLNPLLLPPCLLIGTMSKMLALVWTLPTTVDVAGFFSILFTSLSCPRSLP